MNPAAYDLIVVGAGPAGLAAAAEAAAHACKVLLVDAGEGPGGHYFKELPEQYRAQGEPHDAQQARQLAQYRRRLGEHGVRLLNHTQVWGIFQGSEATFEPPPPGQVDEQDQPYSLYLDGPEGTPPVVSAPALILAPGVYDRPLPFPGWTLPGVITPGAAQMLLKRQGLLPGRRILVAGSGPLQLAVAANLAEAGAEVVACIDACASYEAMQLAPLAFWGQWSRLGEFAGYLASLLRRRVPLHFRQAIRYAEGDAERGVTAAYVGPVDSQGMPIRGALRAYQVDSICCSSGFLPSIQLTLHLGCRHVYSPWLGAFVPQHDERMQTDRRNVFVAGDVTGVGGKPLAELQGRLAALSALESLGRLTAAQAASQRADLAPAIASERRFERFLWQRYRFREGLLGALSDDTVLCRCENVTLGELRESFRQGARTITGVKGRTRLGMGLCQGRYCIANANALLAGLGQLSPQEVGLMHIRPPVVPVRIQDIADLEEL